VEVTGAMTPPIDSAGGEPCGVAIGVAAVRVMRGAAGGQAGTSGGGGPPPWRDGTADGCVGGGGGGSWKDSMSTAAARLDETTSSLVMETAGSIASSSIRSTTVHVRLRPRCATQQHFIYSSIYITLENYL